MKRCERREPSSCSAGWAEADNTWDAGCALSHGVLLNDSLLILLSS